MRLDMQAYGAHALLSMLTAELPVNHCAEYRHKENRSPRHNGNETICPVLLNIQVKTFPPNEWLKLASPVSKT